MMIRPAWMTFALFLLAAPASAADLFMIRSTLPAPEAMAVLQDGIVARGYTISRLQDVSGSLAKRNFQSDSYRVVFFGKPEEVKSLVASYPALTPYLPLSITIFAEDEDSILVAGHPSFLAKLFPDPGLKPVFARWEQDMQAIMDKVREAR